jgi:hypothetical protein
MSTIFQKVQVVDAGLYVGSNKLPLIIENVMSIFVEDR